MSTLTALARLEAMAAGLAQPLATVRHCHVDERPLVLIPLKLAGEAAAPLAVLAGTDRAAPRLLAVPQPRNRDLRFRFAADLAAVVLPYVESCRGDAERLEPAKDGTERNRYLRAPQILVPNAAGAGFLRMLGRSTRFRRPDGPYPVDPAVPVLGRWLTWFADRHQHPGSALLGAMTELLRTHWATGQSSLEDGNLAALLGWIDPRGGLTGPAAAALAEDPVRCPPAGPATDPTFDNEVLAPAITAYDEAAHAETPDPAALDRARQRVCTALETQLLPTWELMWRAVDLLRALPAGASVPARWDRDRDSFTWFAETFDEGVPQPRRDSAVSAARRLHDMERAQESYDVQRAFDDPLVLAEHRLAGEAFGGVVTGCEPTRVDDSGKRAKLRPRLRVRTADPVRLEAGRVVVNTARPTVKAVIIAIGAPAGTTGELSEGAEILLELTAGMGRRLQPEPGTVPAAGERVCFAALPGDGWARAVFPAREDTPWTHGGPPAEYVPADEDAQEEWS